MDNRQLYPDFLRSTSIAKIVVFHYFGWQLLTYLPSLGIMFALAGWFVANSLNARSAPTVIYHRLARLLPTWWAFALLTLIAGFFYAQGAGVSLQPTLAWLFPYERAIWGLDNAYANDAVVVTWYIAAYMWLMLLSPLLLYIYRKLSWVAIFAPVIAMTIYSRFHPYQDTVFGENWYAVLTFGGCWMLGFAKADGTIHAVPKYLVWTTTVICCACGILMTREVGSLSSNPVALSVMSFGVAFLLLSINPDLAALPAPAKAVVRTINTYAVTIYLFHNILIDIAQSFGGRIGAYNFGSQIGNWSCFVITVALIYLVVKTIGIVETHKWIKRA
jgi:hypothetical protein